VPERPPLDRSTPTITIDDMSAESRLKELNLELPPAPKPGGVYKPVVQVGNLIYVSGHGPIRTDGSLIRGRVGVDITEEEAFAAARQVGLTILASVRAYLGTLDRVVRTVKSLGMVNAVPEFTRHPQVINGYSELLRDVFGENGVGARSAVGMGSLPGNIPVEIEVIFEVRD
jgi:enamine deaminase RidA (YjgF/YER057c/UK114 family)